jgi:hypothetical protein
MLDESQEPSTATITGNRIHEEPCADGIDIRASGTARNARTSGRPSGCVAGLGRGYRRQVAGGEVDDLAGGRP